jgi:hypothetical protein
MNGGEVFLGGMAALALLAVTVKVQSGGGPAWRPTLPGPELVRCRCSGGY